MNENGGGKENKQIELENALRKVIEEKQRSEKEREKKIQSSFKRLKNKRIN
jgi:hypothetical protein